MILPQTMTLIFQKREIVQYLPQIQNTTSFFYHILPQSNGQVEATNKILICVLEKTVETGWD